MKRPAYKTGRFYQKQKNINSFIAAKSVQFKREKQPLHCIGVLNKLLKPLFTFY